MDDKKRNQLLMKGKDFHVHAMRAGVKLHSASVSALDEGKWPALHLGHAKWRPVPSKLEAGWVLQPAWTF